MESGIENIDLTKIKLISQQLIHLLIEKFPVLAEHKNYTIWINLWSDNTFQVRCVSAIGDICHEYKWYKDEITYSEKKLEFTYGID